MLALDGSIGEGGGQVLRSALTLSVATGRAFRMTNVRARREKPGLRRQHLAALRAAAEVSGAEVSGATVGSQEIEFRPSAVRPGSWVFDVGTAGSTTLVLQTVLLPLALAGGPSEVTLLGGTHNPWAPPFEFLDLAFLPLVGRMGLRVRAALDRPGFFPAGGGCVRVSIGPATDVARLDLPERGDVVARRARVLLAGLPAHVAEREQAVLVREAGLRPQDVAVAAPAGAAGPGNAIALEVRCRHVTEVFSAIGRRGLPAEDVARGVVEAAAAWEASGVPVGPHLADQLLLPMALLRGGSFRTGTPTPHTTTNAAVIEAFLGPAVTVSPDGPGTVRVDVRGAAGT